MGDIFPDLFSGLKIEAGVLARHVSVLSSSICVSETYIVGNTWKAVIKKDFRDQRR